MSIAHFARFAAIAAAVPERTAIIHRGRHLSYAALVERSQRLAHVLVAHGLGTVVPRDGLPNWVSGQDHIGLFMRNCPEYLEATLGADAARTVPFNVNYRYTEDELVHLFEDAGTAALIFHSDFAAVLTGVLPRLRHLPLLLQVDDGSGRPLLPGALDFETALAQAAAGPLTSEASPDDLYMLYTGGTTGLPKGTLWRQGDIYDAALHVFGAAPGKFGLTLDEYVAHMLRRPHLARLPLPPFMHGAAQWMALGGLMGGATIVIQDVVDRLDPVDVWTTVAREQVNVLMIVGNAFARPLCDELARHRDRYDTRTLFYVATGGAITSAETKQRLLDLLPGITLSDGVGSSETGSQLSQTSTGATPASTGTFDVMAGTCVVSDDRSHILPPGHDGVGWLARQGTIPLGYLGDQTKTEHTFPVIEGVRMVVPGDRARHLAGGRVELLGRESVTINTGGEKVFAEEVEQALLSHTALEDVLVVGRPSERWGHEVVAVVQLRTGAEAGDRELMDAVAGRLAPFKVPKDIVRVDRIVRSPSGKPDYGWARRVVSPASP